MLHFTASPRAGIGSGESDEDVAGAVAGVAAHAPETERNAASQALELRGQQRGVGGDDHDDRAGVVVADANARTEVSRPTAMPAMRSCDCDSVVALHQHADGVAAGLGVSLREAVPVPPLKP